MGGCVASQFADEAELPALEVKDVSVTYRGAGFPAISRVTFTVGRGEVLAVLGPSGSGKTSILRAIAGFVRRRGTSSGGWLQHRDAACLTGEIWLNGIEASDFPPQKRGVAMVRQTWDLLPHLSVLEALHLTGRLEGTERGEVERRSEVVLRNLGLWRLRNRRPGQLSGGEVQRVALAKVLVRVNLGVCLFDECMGSLDSVLRSELLELIEREFVGGGAASVWVTHDLREARRLAQQLVILGNGCVEQTGTLEEIMKYPATENVFRLMTGYGPEFFLKVGSPEWRSLVESLRGPLECLGVVENGVLAVRPGGWSEVSDTQLGVEGRVVAIERLAKDIYRKVVDVGGWRGEVLSSVNGEVGQQCSVVLDQEEVVSFPGDGEG